MRVVPIVLGAAAAVLLRGIYKDTLANPLSAHYSPWLAHFTHWRKYQAASAIDAKVQAEAAALDAKIRSGKFTPGAVESARFAAQTHDAHDQVIPPEH
jgi:hypothetical protein